MILKLYLIVLIIAFPLLSLSGLSEEKSNINMNDKIATSPDTISPLFFFSKKPSILVSIDGPPVYKKMGNNISQLINSSFTIFKDSSSKILYLKAAERWFSTNLTSSFPIKNWHTLQKIPNTLKNIILSKKLKSDNMSETPEIIASIEPAELIQTDGDPVFIQIPAIRLSYVSNSDSDLFRYTETNQYYLLVTGRWFQSDKLEGPWIRINSTKLPRDFWEIPYNSPKWSVLSSISGTVAAKNALQAATKVSFIKVPKKENITLPLTLPDKPIWQEFSNQHLAYLQNSTIPIFKDEKYFYCCYNAAWYISKELGIKWSVATTLPNKIHDLPPSAYVFFTKFIRIYKVTDEFVEFGFTAGYNNVYIKDGCIVYGSGTTYPSVWNNQWYPRPFTYGLNVNYNPFEKRWTRCNRYLEHKSTHVKWISDRNIPYTIPIQPGNYTRSRDNEIQTTESMEDENEEDNESPSNLKKESFDTRLSGDWDTPIDDTALDPPNRINDGEHRSVRSARIKSGINKTGRKEQTNSINSMQRGVSRFERYRTYNSKSLRQSYGGGRNRTGTIDSRGQYQGIFH